MSIVFSGCDKDDDKNGSDDEHIQLLETIFIDDKDGKVRVKYEYDEQNRIAKITQYYDDKFDHFFTFSYKSNEISIKSDDNSTYTYSINGNRMTSSRVDYGYETTEVIDIDNEGLPEKYVQENLNELYNNWTYTANYEFQDDNLVKLKEKREGKDSWSCITTLTYDDKKSPFYHCKTPMWILIWYGSFDSIPSGKNNVLSRNWGSNSSDGCSYVYTYDDAGFPLTYTIVRGREKYTGSFTYIKRD